MKALKALSAAAILLIANGAMAVPFDYSCTDCPLLIPPSGTSGTTISTLSVADSGTINTLELFIDATHTFSGDLEIYLEHDGTSVLIQDNIGGSTDFTPTTYDLNASAFIGMDLSGDWILTIVDTIGGDSGELFSWSISGDATPPPAVAEPGMLALYGLGLIGLGVARRRMR